MILSTWRSLTESDSGEIEIRSVFCAKSLLTQNRNRLLVMITCYGHLLFSLQDIQVCLS